MEKQTAKRTNTRSLSLLRSVFLARPEGRTAWRKDVLGHNVS